MVRRTRLRRGDYFQGRATGATLLVEALPKPQFGGRLDGPLIFRRVYGEGEARVPEHRHMEFKETFKVMSGFADMWIEGEGEVFLKPGELRTVHQGVAHTHPRRHGSEPLEVRQTIAPATEGALAFVNTLGHLMLDGRDDEGEVPALAALGLLNETRGRTYLARLPAWPQRTVLFPLAGQVARRRYDLYLARID
jgi:mannose-6-phosphate isomerase-like protein (cupin superfamily)